MANEISRTTRLSWTRNGAQIICAVTETADQTGEQAIQNVQIIGATSETLTFGDVTSPGYVMFKNATPTWSSMTAAERTATGYANEAAQIAAQTVYVSKTNPATTVAANMEAKLKPGQGVSLSTNITTWYAIATTDPTNLLVTAIEA